MSPSRCALPTVAAVGNATAQAALEAEAQAARDRTEEADRQLLADAALEQALLPQARSWAAARDAGPGVNLDRIPPPDAAVTARIATVHAGARKSLTVLRSNRACEEAARTFRQGCHGGLEAATYPKRTAATCHNLAEAEAADALGFGATQAVCPTCPHNPRRSAAVAALDLEACGLGPADGVGPAPPCSYVTAAEDARRSDHLIVTVARAAASLAALGEDADLVFLLDDALHVLAPVFTAHEVAVADFLRLACAAAAAGRAPSCRDGHWWDALQAVARAAATAVAAGRAACLPLPPAARAPHLWPGTLWGVFRAASKGRPASLPRGLIRICAAAASGDLTALVLHRADCPPPVGPRSGPAAAGAAAGASIPGVSLSLSAAWIPRLPENATIIAVEDAAPPPAVAVRTAVRDITVAECPAWRFRAVQLPRRVTAGTRPGPLADLIRGHLDAYPAESLAVILPGSRRRAECLRGSIPALLTEAQLQRVCFTSWYEDAPLVGGRVLALGVPALPPLGVRQRLLSAGCVDAAASDGDWDRIAWDGRQVDGATRRVAGQGYRDLEWARAYAEAIRLGVSRRLAGVSAPLTFVTDHDLDLLVVTGPGPLDCRDELLLRALRCAATAPAAAGGQRGAARVTTSELATATGVPKVTVTRRMGVMLVRGLVERIGTRGGWRLPSGGAC